MAEMDEATSTSPLPSPPPLESDEISVFFHNIHRSCRSRLLPDSEQHRVKNGTSASANESSSSKRRNLLAAESDLDDFDSKSEVFKEGEGFDAWKELSNRAPSRASKRRSRAAEVHNLSEKRRRSRINEKMKALQSLIPNSNKTDKASMLDEVIEYLKQLQLQVQMLSMRNGLGLHPTYLPGGLEPLHLPQVQMGFNEGNGMLEHMNMGSGVLPSMTNITIPDTSYGLDSQIQVHQRPFQLYTTSEEIYREEILPRQQLHIHHSRNPSEHMETSEDILPKNSDNNRILIQQLHSSQTGRSVAKEDGKINTLDF